MTRTRKTITRLGLGAAAGAALALAAPLTASAHIHVDPESAPAGSSSILTFTVGHGCDGSPTTEVTIGIPDEVTTVKPVVNPGWAAATSTEPVEDGVTDAHGNPVSERTSAVTFTANTPLDDGQIDMLSVQVSVPEDAEGQTLAFPVTQTCESGSIAWDQAAEDGEDEPESPAPVIEVTKAEAAHGEHGDTSAPAANGDDSAAASAASSNGDDLVARTIGLAGLAVGAAGIVLAVVARRPRTKEKK